VIRGYKSHGDGPQEAETQVLRKLGVPIYENCGIIMRRV